MVATPWERTYLDFTESGDPQEPLAIGSGPPLEKVCSFRPPDGMLGIQGRLWTEYLPTPQLIEWRALPRLAAIVEVGWCNHDRDFPDFSRRLADHLPRQDALGPTYRPLENQVDLSRAQPRSGLAP